MRKRRGKPAGKHVRAYNGHAHLVRASVLAVRAMQQACDVMPDGDAKTACVVALTAMDAVLHGRPVRHEKVVIGICDGLPIVKAQTEFVTVDIEQGTL